MTRRRFVATSAAVASGAALGGCASLGASSPRVGASEYTRLDAHDLARLVDRAELSPSEVLEWAIDRAEAINPKLNAIVVEHFDRARKLARGSLPSGPLRGVPFLLKDLWVDLAGTVTTNGSRLFADAVARESNTLASRYEAAGLVIFGKTASPEFGSNSSTESLLHGDTRNPWDPTRSSGGSSGGSAVAVATGVVPAAHASDGGGSIRIPASCCGIFGLKPSRGRVPTSPTAFDKAAGVGINHVVSRSVRDSALLLDLTAEPLLGDPYIAPPAARAYVEEVGRDPGRLRIGLQRKAALPV
ncbi:MAG: amidase, partial [bacterium]|nr:amidase [bacterium]